jgi:hypothetical protein
MTPTAQKLSDHIVDLATGFDLDDVIEALISTAIVTVKVSDGIPLDAAKREVARLAVEGFAQ